MAKGLDVVLVAWGQHARATDVQRMVARIGSTIAFNYDCSKFLAMGKIILCQSRPVYNIHWDGILRDGNRLIILQPSLCRLQDGGRSRVDDSGTIPLQSSSLL
jgi:hypothetical protein